MKTKICMIIGVMLVTHLALAQQKPWSLEQCIDTALANNRNVKQKKLNHKSSEISYKQSKLDLLPNLNGSVSQSFSFGRSPSSDGTFQNVNSSNSTFGLSSGITLYDGLRMKYKIDARFTEMKATQADLEQMKRDIAMSVSTAYLQVLLNKELAQVASDQLILTESKIEQRKALVLAGKMAEGEMYELLAQEAKEQQSALQAKNNLSQTLLDLVQILELKSDDDFDVVVPDNLAYNDLELLNPNSVYDSALVHRPDIKSVEYRLKTSEKNVQIARSAFYPSLSFGVNVGSALYNFVPIPVNTSLGFNLSIPVFNKFETRNQVKSAQLSVESSKLTVENTKIEIKKAIQQAYNNALAAKAGWEAAQKSESASREAYRFVNQKYEAGRATVYELYQAKNNLTQVLSSKTQSKYEYFFRVKMLELLR